MFQPPEPAGCLSSEALKRLFHLRCRWLGETVSRITVTRRVSADGKLHRIDRPCTTPAMRIFGRRNEIGVVAGDSLSSPCLPGSQGCLLGRLRSGLCSTCSLAPARGFGASAAWSCPVLRSPWWKPGDRPCTYPRARARGFLKPHTARDRPPTRQETPGASRGIGPEWMRGQRLVLSARSRSRLSGRWLHHASPRWEPGELARVRCGVGGVCSRSLPLAAFWALASRRQTADNLGKHQWPRSNTA